jgi:signal transduction histidine kinase
MSWQYSPLALVLGISAALLASFTLFAWNRRKDRGIVPVLIIFAAATLWSAAYAVSLSRTDLVTSVAMNWLADPAIVAIPVAYLLLALWYTEQDHHPSRLFILLLCVIPVLSICLVLTNNFHHLYYTGFSLVGGPRNSVMWAFDRGPLYWITTSYSVVLILVGLLLFVLRYRTVGALFRTQISLLLAAGLLPFLATLIYLLDLGPDTGFDLTPVTLVVSSFALTAAILTFELFSLQPLTHSLVVKTLKEGVVATNAEGRITLVNPAGTALIGATEDEAVGRSLGELEPGLGRFIFRTGSPATEDEIELPAGAPSRIYAVQAVAIPTTGEHGEGTILTLRDVTDRKHAENAVRAANHQLSLLSGIVRHDIKNKLAALFLYLELVTGSPGRTDDPALGRIRESAEGIRTLIDFTQEFQDLGSTAPSWQNVGEVLAGARRQLDCAGLRLIDETGGLEIRADQLFQRVIYNLLDNAIRYARGMTRFSLRCAMSDGRLILFVEDDGPGIPEENKERIFEKGFGNNTGLGLFLTREILGITGITIRETGEPGTGARFELTVPPGSYRFTDPGKAAG